MEELVIESRYRGEWRKVILIAGNIYKVEPLNQKNMKHRGRLCEFIRCFNDEIRGIRDIIEVRFLDTKRIGRVDGSDLIVYSGS